MVCRIFIIHHNQSVRVNIIYNTSFMIDNEILATGHSEKQYCHPRLQQIAGSRSLGYGVMY